LGEGVEVARNSMTRIVYVLIALIILLPLLYVIFFTSFIPFVLRQLKIGRSVGGEKSQKVVGSGVEAEVHAGSKEEPEVIIPDEVLKAPSKK
jgi:hypothetical protein